MVKPEEQLKPLKSQGSSPTTELLGLLKYINSSTAEAVNQMQTEPWDFYLKHSALGFEFLLRTETSQRVLLSLRNPSPECSSFMLKLRWGRGKTGLILGSLLITNSCGPIQTLQLFY